MKEVLQLDLFTVSTVEPPWRDNRDAMAYPFLALQKRRTKPIEFSRNGLSLEVHAPTKFGIATIWDWDLVIFAASHLNEAVEDGRKPSPRIRFVPYDCLRQIGRGTSGRHYRELAQAIRRLMATLVITNIRSHDQLESGEESGFHWLCGFKIPKKYTRAHFTQDDPDGEPDPARPWEIELTPWLYNAILNQRDILAVHPDYFGLTGGIERWLYRLARKAVPDKAEVPAFSFRLETLHEQSGVTGLLKHFRARLKQTEQAQPLPEYGIRIDRKGRHELVILYRDRTKLGRLPRGFRLTLAEGDQRET